MEGSLFSLLAQVFRESHYFSDLCCRVTKELGDPRDKMDPSEISGHKDHKELQESQGKQEIL